MIEKQQLVLNENIKQFEVTLKEVERKSREKIAAAEAKIPEFHKKIQQLASDVEF
jgi:hypothetical protein